MEGQNMRSSLLLISALGCGALLAAGCSDDGDGGKLDKGVPDAAADQMTADTNPNADAVTPDTGPVTDAGPSSGKVMYLTGSSSSNLTLYAINSNGTGKTAVAGFPAQVSVEVMDLRGIPAEFSQVNRHRPVNMYRNLSDLRRHVALPGTLGDLYYLVDKTTPTGGRGFWVVKPDGTISKLAYEPGETSASYGFYVYMNEKGTMFAATKSSEYRAPHLIKTDGTTFSGGKTICDISSGSSAPWFFHMSFADSHFYLTAGSKTAGSWKCQSCLYRAPLDCSAKYAEVKFPNIGTAGMGDIVWQYFTRSKDGKKLAAVAKAKNAASDVFIIDDATGALTNVSNSPGTYYYAGGIGGQFIMHYSAAGIGTGMIGTMLDLSPTGKYVTYVRKYGNPPTTIDELYIRDTAASSPAAHLTGATNFADAVGVTRSPTWISDDDLLFWAGVTESTMDMYHYKVSTAALVNLTKTGGTTKPFAGGKIKPHGGWYSPNGKYLYYLEYGASGTSGTLSDIKAIDLTTLAIKEISKGLYVHYKPKTIEAAPTGSRVFFYAETGGDAGDDPNVYYFDQNTASTPVKLTTFTKPSSGSWYIHDLIPNTAGTMVAFGAGSASSTLDLYVATATATPALTKLTTTQGYLSDNKLFTTDGKSIVYGTGTSSSALDLRIQPLTGGAHKVLEATAGYTGPILAY
jgi:hypothetical protein